MLRRAAFAFALLLAVPIALPGCSLYQAYAQREAIRQAQFHLKGVSVDGVDFSGANLTITLELDNPTDTDIALDRIDYTLFVNELRALSGSTSSPLRVPARDVRPLAIHTTVRFRDISNEVRSLWLRGGRFSYRVAGTGHFDTPFGAIDYPVAIGPYVSP